MADFLTLGGLPVPARDGTVSQNYGAVGGFGQRAHSGNWRAQQRGLVDGLTFTTKQLNFAEIKKLRQWIAGKGIAFSFDVDLYSHDGRGPDPGFSAVVTPSGGQFGGYATVTLSTVLVYVTGIVAPFTFGVWKQVSGGGWNHYVITDDGTTVTQYKNGLPHTPIAGDDITLWASLAAGSLTVEGKDIDGSAANSDYDDLFAVPWVADADDVAAWYAQAIPFSPLPALSLSGDIVGGDVITVNVSELSGGVVQFGDNVGWNSNGQQLTFTLQEKTRRAL